MLIKRKALTLVLATTIIFLIKYPYQYEAVNPTICQSKQSVIPVLLTQQQGSWVQRLEKSKEP